MKKVLSLLVLSSIFLSCSNDFEKEEVDSNLHARTSLREANEDFLLKKKFSLALHEAMRNNVNLRTFLKQEALKKFNGDYDILYNFVKDDIVNGNSFRNTILPYFDSEEELTEIETKIPTLTIFIPTLPEESFSANTWNVDSQVPYVAVRLLDYDKTAIFSSSEESFTLENNQIPGFPVIVVKENERVTVPQFNGYATTPGREFSSSSGFRWRFLNGFIWNNIPNALIDGSVEPSTVAAWNVNGQSQNIGWQRDHIYYGININNPNGPFINNYQERISSFRMVGVDGRAALSTIAQPNGVANLADPTLLPNPFIVSTNGGLNGSSFWTDGDFEFGIYLYHGSNSSNEGSRLEVGLSANPNQLFNIRYKRVRAGVVFVYFIESIDILTMPTNVEFLTWDLQRYSNTWKIDIEEVDATEELTSSTVEFSKYNANFALDGVIKKIGMKLGASLETTSQTTVTRKRTVGSNPLKEVTVNFGDNIIIGQTTVPNNTFYQLRRYSSGDYSIAVRPVRVQ